MDMNQMIRNSKQEPFESRGSCYFWDFTTNEFKKINTTTGTLSVWDTTYEEWDLRRNKYGKPVHVIDYKTRTQDEKAIIDKYFNTSKGTNAAKKPAKPLTEKEEELKKLQDRLSRISNEIQEIGLKADLLDEEQSYVSKKIEFVELQISHQE